MSSFILTSLIITLSQLPSLLHSLFSGHPHKLQTSFNSPFWQKPGSLLLQDPYLVPSKQTFSTQVPLKLHSLFKGHPQTPQLSTNSPPSQNLRLVKEH